MANASNYFYEISRLKDGRTIKSLAKELMGNRFPSKSGERYFLNQLIEARSPKKVANIIRPYYDKTPININTMGKKTGEIARTPVDTTPMVNTYGESVPLDQWRKKGSISLNEPLSPNKGTSTAVSSDRKLPQSGQQITTKLKNQPPVSLKPTVEVSPNLAKNVSLTNKIQPDNANVNSDPVKKIISAIKGAQPLSREQKIKVSNLRGKQFAKLMATRGKTSGEQGYFAELGALKGGAKKVDYDTIRPSLQQGDIDTLFNRVNDANIGEWEKLSAKGALTKLLSKEGATIPTQNELKLLNEVFGSEFTKSILDKRSVWQKILSGAGEALNLPRSLMASFDLSAPLRQGLVMTSRPKQFFPAFLSMFKQAGSDKAFKAVQESITQRQTYKLMRESKLALTDMSPLMTNREETFMSNLGEKIPGVKYGVKASSRAYTGFLNKLRADVFDDMVSKAKSLGLNEKTVASDIAKFVNSATGRGDLGRLNNAATALNGVFFSPRLMASRINLLNPAYYVGLDPFVRKQAVKSMLTMGALAGSTLGLAKATEAHSRPDSPPLAG